MLSPKGDFFLMRLTKNEKVVQPYDKKENTMY